MVNKRNIPHIVEDAITRIKQITTNTDKDGGDGKKEVALQRQIGLFSAMNMIMGSMIGSGIFVAPAHALSRTKSVGGALLVWVLCGILTLFRALAYAELGTVVPRSGGEIAYLKEGYSELHRFWGALPSFTCSWTTVLIHAPASDAVGALIFSDYVVKAILPSTTLTDEYRVYLRKMIAFLVIGLEVTINCFSVKLYVRLQNFFTISKLSVCAVIIVTGVYSLITGHTENLENPFENTTASVNDINLAIYSCFWAYGGWSAVNLISEEMKTPEKNILISISTAVPVVTLVYVLMNISYMTVLTFHDITTASAVAVDFGNEMLGSFAFIIPLGVACSTFGCTLNGAFTNPRMMYISSQNGHIMEIFSYIHITRMTPVPGILLHGLLCTVFLITGEIITLIDLIGFLTTILFAFTMVALLILRSTRKDAYRPFRVPTIIVLFNILTTLFLAGVPIFMDPSPKYLLTLVVIAVGILLYTPLIHYKLAPSVIIKKLTQTIQKLLLVVPVDSETSKILPTDRPIVGLQ